MPQLRESAPHSTAGVCLGEFLIAVPARIEDGIILIPLELPQAPE
jgi:hypothetical protein